MLLLIFVGVLWAKCSLQGISVTEWQRKDHQGRRSSLCYAVILFVWWSASLSEWIRAGYVTATCSMLPRTGWEIVGINSCAYPIWIVLILLSLGISDACLQTLYPVVRRAGRWSTLMAARHRVCTNLLSEIFPLNEIRVNGLIAKNAYLTKVRTCWLKFRWLNLLWSWAKHEIQVRQLKGMMNWWYIGGNWGVGCCPARRHRLTVARREGQKEKHFDAFVFSECYWCSSSTRCSRGCGRPIDASWRKPQVGQTSLIILNFIIFI
jgi:hypothetical protein